MPGLIIVGSQYGDEGKGKIVDLMAENADCVIRYQGGNNAGHSIVVSGKLHKFHSLPSGALRNKRCLIGCGVVLDPKQLVKELEELKREANIGIDPRTPIILPYHNLIDGVREKQRKKKSGSAIGTTAKGIGPAYEDEKNRTGIRFFDLVSDQKKLEDLIKDRFEEKKKILELIYEEKVELKIDDVIKEYVELGEKLKPFMTDVSTEVAELLQKNKKVLFEGAQGTMLDIAYGNYPKVTSSHPMTGAVLTGVGLPPKIFQDYKFRIIGIVKAYTTKVGSGPVVTCLDKGNWPVNEEVSEKEAKYIRKKGKEIGTTTGRARRVGWLDLVMLKYSQQLNGFKELALTKIDTLAGLETLKVAIAYEHQGKKITEYKAWDLEFLNQCKPIYKEVPGFEEFSAESYKKLPKNVKTYIKLIEDYVEVPVTIISTSPERKETIFKKEVFKKF